MTNNHTSENSTNLPPPQNIENNTSTPEPSTSQEKLNVKSDLEFLDQIGEGGFGSVYRATLRGKLCAVKVIQKVNRKGKNRTEAINNEISILNDLQHPSIIRTLGSWTGSSSAKIVLDLASGGDLADLLDNSIVTEKQAKQYILQIASALQYIHDKKIIHRDLKLENILLTHDNKIKLTDFGIATRASDGLAYGNRGTPHAKAPEVITEESYTKAVDWWSLGVVFYQLIIREDPFKPSKGKTLEDAIVNSYLRFPVGALTFNCYIVIKRLLEKKVESRINSFEELKSYDFFKEE